MFTGFLSSILLTSRDRQRRIPQLNILKMWICYSVFWTRNFFVVGGKQEDNNEVMVVRGAVEASAPRVDATPAQANSLSADAEDILLLACLHRNLQVSLPTQLGCLCGQLIIISVILVLASRSSKSCRI